MKIELELTEKEWDVLRPLLEPKLASRFQSPLHAKRVDYEYLSTLKCGKKICNILKDGYWGKDMDRDIVFTYELKNVTKEEFLMHRGAGDKTWDVLKDYIDNAL